MRRLLGGLLAFVVLVAACGEATKPGFTAAPAAPTAASMPASTAIPPASSVPSAQPSPSAGVRPDHLVFRGGDGLQSVDAARGTLRARLPLGVPDARWSTLYTTVPGNGTTEVRALDVRTGTVLRRLELAGSWVLPTVVPGDLPVGLAEDAGLLALVDAAPGEGASRFAIVDTALAVKPRIVTLNGRFAFDAIGPDGRHLFLIEQLAGGQYQVRAYDLAAGRLAEGAIVDKRELGEEMEGRPIARSTTDDGAWALTLYEREDGSAFVHQLDTVNAGAFCVDLPETFTSISGEQSKAWRIAANPVSGGFIANDKLGFIGSIGVGDLDATARLLTGVKGLAAGRAGEALLLEPTVLTILGSSLQRTGYGPQVEGSGMVMAPSRTSLYVLTYTGTVRRVTLNASGATAAGSLTLDPAIDWTNAALVGVAEE
jgi:hypothetical protein